MKTIVVGYDETDPAQRALARAADLAEAFGSKVIVTSVAPVLTGSREMGAIDPADPPEEHQQELDHARAFLSGRGIEGEFQLAAGDPADAIVELADAVRRRPHRRRHPPAQPRLAPAGPERERRRDAKGELRRAVVH